MMPRFALTGYHDHQGNPLYDGILRDCKTPGLWGTFEGTVIGLCRLRIYLFVWLLTLNARFPVGVRCFELRGSRFEVSPAVQL